MSLETLLEAAKYLEYRTEANARGEDPQDFVTFLACNNCNNTINNNNNNNGTFSSSSSNGNFDCLLDVESSKDRRRTSGALGTREVHNKLEKNRRAHLKRCFETLKKQIPTTEEKKTSNLDILRSSLRYIQLLKRKEREYELETERLAREKITLQQRLMSLKKELCARHENIDINCILPHVVVDDAVSSSVMNAEDTNSTSTATECGPLSEFEDEEFLDDGPVTDSKPVSNSSSETPLVTPSTSKVRRTTELFRLLCDPPLSSQSHETEGPYIMCWQQTSTSMASTPKVVTKGSSLKSTVASVPITVVQPTKKAIAIAMASGSASMTGTTLPFGQGGSISFPAQIVPHYNGSHYQQQQHQPIQLMPQQMRLITTPSTSTFASSSSSSSSSTTTSSTPKNQMVKVTTSNGQSQIAIAQLATLNFRTQTSIATTTPSSSSSTFTPNFLDLSSFSGGVIKGTPSLNVTHLMTASTSSQVQHVDNNKLVSMMTTNANNSHQVQFLSAQQLGRPVVVVAAVTSTPPPPPPSLIPMDLATKPDKQSSH